MNFNVYFIHSPSGFSWKASRQINILSIKTVTDFLFALAECRIIENRKCRPLTKSFVISVNVGGIFFLFSYSAYLVLLCIHAFFVSDDWEKRLVCPSLTNSHSLFSIIFLGRYEYSFVCHCFFLRFVLVSYHLSFLWYTLLMSSKCLRPQNPLPCFTWSIYWVACPYTRRRKLWGPNISPCLDIEWWRHSPCACLPEIEWSANTERSYVSRTFFLCSTNLLKCSKVFFSTSTLPMLLFLSLTFSLLLSLSLLCGLCTENRCCDLVTFSIFFLL